LFTAGLSSGVLFSIDISTQALAITGISLYGVSFFTFIAAAIAGMIAKKHSQDQSRIRKNLSFLNSFSISLFYWESFLLVWAFF
jgi:hypothetical protein